MNKVTIPRIDYEINGDFINLEQDIGCGEVSRIMLHKTQIGWIASKSGWPHITIMSETIKRRLEILAEKLTELAFNERYRKDIVSYSSGGFEFIVELDALCDLAVEFVNDINKATHKSGQDA